MIFVTLGTQDKSFERLLKAIDKEIEKGTIKDKVVVQAGYTKYESKNMEIFDLVSNDEFDKYMDQCDILITHGGAGSILTGIKKGKIVIAAARLAKFKEHTNDHQKQIVKEFADKGYILELRDFSKLGKLLEKAKTFKPTKFKSNTSNMVKLIDDYIENDNHISWYNKYKEILWYGFFGVFTTLINIISFNILDKVGVEVYLANFIAWVLSVLFAFITNKLFVFNSKSFNIKVLLKEMVAFFVARIVSLGIDMAGMYLLLEIFKFGKMPAKIIVNVIVIVANYVFSKLFVFKKNGEVKNEKR